MNLKSNISTIVASIDLNCDINLNLFMEVFEYYSDKIINIACNNFSNQITMTLQLDKKINVKIFSGGKLTITGLNKKYEYQLQQVYNLLKEYKNVEYEKSIKTKFNEFNLRLYLNYNIIGFDINTKLYKYVGFHKKNDKYFFDRDEVIEFDKNKGLITHRHHLNKVKPLYSINCILIGKSKYTLIGNIIKNNNSFNKNNYICPYKFKDNCLFIEKQSKNLILKNKVFMEIQDNFYIILNKLYKPELFTSKDIIENGIFKYKKYVYGFIENTYNENYLKELRYFKEDLDKQNLTITIYEKIFSKELPEIMNYTIYNINSDLNIDKKNVNDSIFNLNKLYDILSKEQLNYSIVYEPSKYPAMKFNFGDKTTKNSEKACIMLFRTYKCKISTNVIDNIKKMEDFILNIINKYYNEIVIKNIDTSDIIKEELSIDDII